MQTGRLICAYATVKLNLTLGVLGRRADGYHLLDMVVRTVSVYDTLPLTPTQTPGVGLLYGRAGVPCGEENTMQRAAHLFYQAVHLPNDGTQTRMLKRIPDQAGMSGGSADAAAVLRAVSRIHDTGFTMDELRVLGLRIGVDVPFRLRGGTMRTGGIDEVLTPLSPMPQCFFVVRKPSVSASTAAVFAWADCDGTSYPHYTPAMIKTLEIGELPLIAGSLGNSFSLTLPESQIEELRQALLRMGASDTCMIGSDSAVFGVFSERVPAEQCREELRKKHCHVFVCEPVGAKQRTYIRYFSPKRWGKILFFIFLLARAYKSKKRGQLLD